MAALQQLNDPAIYTRYDNIPVFKAHKRRAKKADGTEFDITVTDKDLDTIADNAKSLIEYEGVPLKITDGHCKPDPKIPEKDQPGLLGFATNPHVGTYGPSKQKAVLVTQYIRNDKLPLLKDGQRPFRSAEYYPPTKQITGIAMLLRDPFLDMGFVTYGHGRHNILYAMENDMPDPAAPMPDKGEEFTPEEVQHFEKLCRYMQMKGYMAPPAPAPAAPAPDAAGPGAPGGGDTNVPKEEPMMNAKNGDPVLYAEVAELKKQNADLQKKNAIAELERSKAECAKIIDKLEAEHYILKRDVEISNLIGKTPQEREAHAQYIRETHAQTPGAEPIQLYQGHVEGGVRTQPITEAESNLAVKEATKLMSRGEDPAVAYEKGLEIVRQRNKAS